ncbi:hypothetical protein FWK35_00006974, partial [Aphis craccivora]
KLLENVYFSLKINLFINSFFIIIIICYLLSVSHQKFHQLFRLSFSLHDLIFKICRLF